MKADATEVVWEEAHQLLKEDPTFGPLVERVGPVRLRPVPESAFYSLVRAIIYQQLAGKAAASIHGRAVEALSGEVRPEVLLETPEERLREAGLSRSKLRAVRDLAERVASGGLELESLVELSDRGVEKELVQVWGIGPWTARMFLLFHLRRPDVWPTGDLGVRQGWARIHGAGETPDAETLGARGNPYRPWRSAVAWYCWRAVDLVTPHGELVDPGPGR